MSPTIVDLTSARPDEHQKDSLDGSDHLLQDALSDANRDRLYETLLVLCRSNDIAQRVKDMLLVGEDRVQSKMYNKKRDLSDDENDKDSDSEAEDSEDEVEDEDEGDESDESTSANDVISTEPSRGGYHNIHENRGVSGQVPTGLKRLRSRYAECHNCSEEFDVTQNQKHDCIWHPGEREVNHESETWWDWDDDCHGPKCDQEDDFPEGFMWTCCEQSGDRDGCRIGTHVEMDSPSKRARY